MSLETVIKVLAEAASSSGVPALPSSSHDCGTIRFLVVVGQRSRFLAGCQLPLIAHILCPMASAVFKASRGKLLAHQIPHTLNLCPLLSLNSKPLTFRAHVIRPG